jgi:mitogen-activated protein kinase 4/6
MHELFLCIVENDKVDDVTAANFFYKILQGIHHFYENYICHRNLKPGNLFLKKNNKNIKIIDLRLSNMYLPNEILQEACESLCYTAPEMIVGMDYYRLQVGIVWSHSLLYAL